MQYVQEDEAPFCGASSAKEHDTMKRNLAHKALLWLASLVLVLAIFPSLAIGATRPIALDSGHGGGDEGAVYGGLVERDLNWEITQACKAELERMGYSVVIVNTSSQNYDLDERVQRAVNNNCPVIVSLHNNAWDRVSKQRRGCTVLVPNSSSYEGGLYGIGQRFAAEVTSNIKSQLGIPLWGDGSYERDYPAGESGSTYPDGSRSDYYGIIRYARRQGIFGCIIEHAYLDSSEDAKILRSKGTLEKLGVIDAHAIDAFYDEFVSYADESQAARVASGWWVKASNGRWWFCYSNHTYPAGRMLQIKGVTYAFDKSGWMVTGWGKYDGKWYWFDKNGALLRDGWTDDGYYVDANGVWDTSVPQREVEPQPQGEGQDEPPKPTAKAEWVKSGNRWWYRHADGSYTTSGWEKIDGTWYLFDASGWMRTGWARVGGTWYYLKSSGAMATGWSKVDGTWYFLRESGAMATGWLKDGGTWYYLDSSGAMYASRWVKSGGKWYYLGSNGGMYVSRTTPDGYEVDESGAWVA